MRVMEELKFLLPGPPGFMLHHGTLGVIAQGMDGALSVGGQPGPSVFPEIPRLITQPRLARAFKRAVVADVLVEPAQESAQR